ncbi:META domain-containing protein [Terricaulis silvestris]|uniref:META domain protein n=1 Tax=Terricaulis silvestris TaxID=2686094 RepID=A0A6I6ML24_9CAUL|nr:META domain-containing protein [Terricaulis silvestris]QGZ93876.1 META domain protein [Terricaulis silvestris]
MRVAILVAALAMLGACATAPDTAVELTGSEWALITDAQPSPTIDFTDQGASGFAGCNRWFSSIERTGDQLSFGDIGLTRMMCPAPQMTTERTYTDALNRTDHVRIEGNELVLSGSGADLLRFRRTN